MGETFVIPEARIQDSMLIPGTNGGKMSKSANNIINIFLDDKACESKSWALKPTVRHSKNLKIPILVMHLQSILCSPVLNNLQQ
jgi:tryptophanyl-tRNA synthetase